MPATRPVSRAGKIFATFPVGVGFARTFAMARRFEVRARRLNTPPLWCWEIVDTLQGRVIESSWIRSWRAFNSRDEALEDARRQPLVAVLVEEGPRPQEAA